MRSSSGQHVTITCYSFIAKMSILPLVLVVCCVMLSSVSIDFRFTIHACATSQTCVGLAADDHSLPGLDFNQGIRRSGKPTSHAPNVLLFLDYKNFFICTNIHQTSNTNTRLSKPSNFQAILQNEHPQYESPILSSPTCYIGNGWLRTSSKGKARNSVLSMHGSITTWLTPLLRHWPSVGRPCRQFIAVHIQDGGRTSKVSSRTYRKCSLTRRNCRIKSRTTRPVSRIRVKTQVVR
jgi:hypothetical protein